MVPFYLSADTIKFLGVSSKVEYFPNSNFVFGASCPQSNDILLPLTIYINPIIIINIPVYDLFYEAAAVDVVYFV